MLIVQVPSDNDWNLPIEGLLRVGRSANREAFPLRTFEASFFLSTGTTSKPYKTHYQSRLQQKIMRKFQTKRSTRFGTSQQGGKKLMNHPWWRLGET